MRLIIAAFGPALAVFKPPPVRHRGSGLHRRHTDVHQRIWLHLHRLPHDHRSRRASETPEVSVHLGEPSVVRRRIGCVPLRARRCEQHHAHHRRRAQALILPTTQAWATGKTGAPVGPAEPNSAEQRWRRAGDVGGDGACAWGC
ncbi:hypothetical protein A4X06_0g4942 [Tilletia controversa]|uniref:Uncharacterized protein n=1 Tax=Tilletia controversa TaxID=13291 RepID=A0A8X7MSK5_9BASI|nr:hypothetical protein CF328_g4333 [Tilletia controversa]KAE8246619.1 hypothetical protein A4X06_0g4942 [Tilletia controversa]